MTDIVVTVPKTFRHPAGPGLKGLAAWIAEGDIPGETWSGELSRYTTYGGRPKIVPGERVYIVCEDRVRGYAPLVKLYYCERRVELIRGGGAVAVTITQEVIGFRVWRYRWWERSIEVAFPDWDDGALSRVEEKPAKVVEDLPLFEGIEG